MAIIDVDQSLTTGVNWEWRETGVPIVRGDLGTAAPGTTVTKTYTLRHNSEDPVVIRGFYLSPIVDLDLYQPFKDGWRDANPAKDVEDLLYWRNQYGGGLGLIQGAVTTWFEAGVGSSVVKLLACTLGDNGDGKILPNQEITIGVTLAVPNQLLAAAYKNLDIKIAYRKVPTE